MFTRQEAAEENPFMGDRLIISDNREDPGNPLVLDGEAIDAAAQDPPAIGKLPAAAALRSGAGLGGGQAWLPSHGCGGGSDASWQGDGVRAFSAESGGLAYQLSGRPRMALFCADPLWPLWL